MTSDDTNDLGKRPVDRPVDKLGDAFGAGKVPNRGAGLAGLNLTPPPAPSTTKAPDSPPKPKDNPNTTSPPPSPAAKSPQRRRNKHAVKPKTTKSAGATAIYLSPELRDRLRDYRARTGRTYTDALLDAIDAHIADLPHLISVRRSQRAADSLFQGQAVVRQHHDDGYAQITVRPSKADLAVIDDLAKQHASGNRSALAAAVWAAYLPTD